MRVMKPFLIIAAFLVGMIQADHFDRLFVGKPEVISSGHQFAEGMAFDAQ